LGSLAAGQELAHAIERLADVLGRLTVKAADTRKTKSSYLDVYYFRRTTLCAAIA
jgi:hypothetical protein